MESKLCMNCFSALDWGDRTCSVCGWDNSKPQIPEGLAYQTMLASRYLIGRVKAMNGEGITYAALDCTTNKPVVIREFFPLSLATRNNEDHTITPHQGKEAVFEQYLDEFIDLSKGISRLRELTVVNSVREIFEENYTAYTVYEYVPSITLRRYVENSGGGLSWNAANRLFMPILTALGLINSLGISHLGISPDTLRVTKDGNLLITEFSIPAAHRMGTPLLEELSPGCAALEQYSTKATCGEVSDVYGFAATLLFALTSRTPQEAPRRLQDQRLMISKDVLHTLPPFAITALANALQVRQNARTRSFERLKTELSASPTVIDEVEQTQAIRRLPPIDLDIPQNRGLPPVVWLIGSGVITLIALIIVASIWLGDRGMSFTDIQQLFQENSVSVEAGEVPNLVNANYEECMKKVTSGEYPFQLKVSTREFSDTVAEGCIISQSPFQGEDIPETGTVLVTVSKGAAKRALPEIKGMSFADLQKLLTDNGFVPVKVEEYSEDVEVGYVLRYQDNKEGESLDYGSTITVVVSSGPQEP